jgi:hypothetical protein
MQRVNLDFVVCVATHKSDHAGSAEVTKTLQSNQYPCHTFHILTFTKDPAMSQYSAAVSVMLVYVSDMAIARARVGFRTKQVENLYARLDSS